MSATECAYLVSETAPPIELETIAGLSLLRPSGCLDRTNVAIAASRVLSQNGTIDELWASALAKPVVYNPTLSAVFLRSIGVQTIPSPVRRAICWVCVHCSKFSWLPAGHSPAEQYLQKMITNVQSATTKGLACGINHCRAGKFRDTTFHKAETYTWTAVDPAESCPQTYADATWEGTAFARLYLYTAHARVHESVLPDDPVYSVTDKTATADEVAKILINKTRSVWRTGAETSGTLPDIRELDIIRIALLCMDNPKAVTFPLNLSYIRDVLVSRAVSYGRTADASQRTINYDPHTGRATTRDGFDVSLFAPDPRGVPVVVLAENTGAAYVRLAISCLADVVNDPRPADHHTPLPGYGIISNRCDMNLAALTFASSSNDPPRALAEWFRFNPKATCDAVLDGPFDWGAFRKQAAVTSSLIDAEDICNRLKSRAGTHHSWKNVRAAAKAYFDGPTPRHVGPVRCLLLNSEVGRESMRENCRQELAWLSGIDPTVQANPRTLLADIATCTAVQTKFITTPMNVLESGTPFNVAELVREWEGYADAFPDHVEPSTDPEWVSWLQNGTALNDDQYIRRFALLRVIIHALDTPLVVTSCPGLRANALAFVVRTITPLDRAHLEDNLWRLRLRQLAMDAVCHAGAYAVALRAACGIGDGRLSYTNPLLNTRFSEMAYSLREVFRPQITFATNYIEKMCYYNGNTPEGMTAIRDVVTSLRTKGGPRFWVLAYAINPVEAERALCAWLATSPEMSNIATQVADT